MDSKPDLMFAMFSVIINFFIFSHQTPASLNLRALLWPGSSFSNFSARG
jgi:hypothetical protein